MDKFVRANQALFDGNRGDIAPLLDDSTPTGRTLWLLAASLEDGDERLEMLARVHAAGEPPYAEMAHGILEREKYFAAEMAKVPGWQKWFQENRPRLTRIAIALPIVLIVLMLGSQFIFPPSPDAAAPVVDENGVPIITPSATSTATATPTVTPLPFDARSVANYMPVGSLRILNVEFPTRRGVLAGSTPATPPPGSAFLAIRYEFTCGTAQAFCDEPPQARVGLQLADPALGILTAAGMTLVGSVPASRIASGSTIQAWVVFAVPTNQAPRQLVIGLDTDGDNEIDSSLSVELPRG